MFLHVGVLDVVKIVIIGYATLRIDVDKIVILLRGVVMFIQCGVVKVIHYGIAKIKGM